MFKFIAILASLATATAFLPVSRVSTRSALQMGYENEIGALPPTGFWDPLGLSKNIDQDTFDNYRECEIKHGRVSMLAVVGYLVQSVYRLPGYIVPPGTKLPGTVDLDGTTFDSLPNGVEAIGAVTSQGWLQIIILIGWLDLVVFDKKAGTAPGDYGIAFQNFIKTDKEKDAYRLRELQNGRLAMLASIELIVHDLSKPAGESLFTLQHF
jgi:hypothetical protein